MPFYILLFLYLAPVCLALYWLTKLVVWIIKKVFQLVIWIVKKIGRASCRERVLRLV